jgi:hypothetical protein
MGLDLGDFSVFIYFRAPTLFGPERSCFFFFFFFEGMGVVSLP